METTALSCTNKNFDAVFYVKDHGQPKEGVVVKFVYNGQEVKSTTNKEGKAQAGFVYAGDTQRVFVHPEGYVGHDREMKLDGPCTNVEGDPDITSEQGEVLGASTFAEAGIMEDMIVKSLGSLGGVMTLAGSVLYAKKR